MTRRSAAPIAAALACAITTGCSSPKPESTTPSKAPPPKAAHAWKPAEPVPSPVAQLSLIASTGTIVPGQRTWLGARFVIANGWHVYGKDPGDAGMPTRVTITTTPGLTIGAPIYPPTKRLIDPGDIETNAYEKEAILLFPMDVAADVAAGTEVKLHAAGSWLACKDQCIKEEGEADLAMNVGATAPAPPESVAAFTRFPPPTHLESTP